eukprot:TRINITY_DN507_c0_g1_i1.p1 TRINITY_DN507_c0_g1~~TRINITY_DN507_c0_g1_i1.p1  ORF type:complete len:1184 (+),score=325.31 TRINITY_DN507_c0_g1_i1:53-3604(+)
MSGAATGDSKFKTAPCKPSDGKCPRPAAKCRFLHKPCKNFKNGGCSKGNDCNFEHDTPVCQASDATSHASKRSSVASTADDSRRKTMLCAPFSEKKCPRSAAKCNFLHPPCNNYAKGGTCSNGNDCRFEHSKEGRPPQIGHGDEAPRNVPAKAPKPAHHNWNAVYKTSGVGPFVMEFFNASDAKWKANGWEPVYDPNERSLVVYANKGREDEARAVCEQARREAGKKIACTATDVILQKGTLKVKFGDGLAVKDLASGLGHSTLLQCVKEKGFTKDDASMFGVAVERGSVNAPTLEKAAEIYAYYKEKMRIPVSRFTVKVLGGAVPKWEGRPCYVVMHGLRPSARNSLVEWAKASKPFVYLVFEKDARDVPVIRCLLPTNELAKAFVGVCNNHVSDGTLAEFKFDDAEDADTLSGLKGSSVHMHSKADPDWMKWTKAQNPLAKARGVAEEAKKKFDLSLFEIKDPPSPGARMTMEIVDKKTGGGKSCLQAHAYAVGRWEDHRVHVNGRLTRVLFERLFATGEVAKHAKQAGVEVPKELPDDASYFGVKGSDAGFGKLLNALGEERDKILPYARMCGISSVLARKLNKDNWVDRMRHTAWVRLEDDAVLVIGYREGDCDTVVESLNEYRKKYKLSTTDEVMCCCGSPSARRLQKCGHVVCDECIVKHAPNCPHDGCVLLLATGDLYDNGILQKDLASRVLRTALYHDAKLTKPSKELGGFGLCPVADCTAVLQKQKKMGICTLCSTRVCVSCKVSDERHNKRTCGEYKKYLESHGPCPACAKDVVLREGSQNCPHCGKSVCSKCGLEDAAAKGHNESCASYREALTVPLMFLFKEARNFAANRLQEEYPGHPYEYTDNVCVRASTCNALQKFQTALEAEGIEGQIRQRLGCFGWHGTKTRDAVRAICCDGWDPKRRSGQVYGTGEYFAYNAATSFGYNGDTNILLVAFILDGAWLNKTTHLVVNNPVDASAAYVVPVGIVCFGGVEVPRQLCGGCGRSSLLKMVLWEWCDMDGQWKQYSDGICADLEKAYRAHKQGTGPGYFDSNLHQISTDVIHTYRVDFATMQQTNMTSGLRGQRKVRRSETAQEQRVFYESHGRWQAYDITVQAAITNAWVTYHRHGGHKLLRVQLPTRKEAYELDFQQKTQRNVETGALCRIAFNGDPSDEWAGCTRSGTVGAHARGSGC